MPVENHFDVDHRYTKKNHRQDNLRQTYIEWAKNLANRQHAEDSKEKGEKEKLHHGLLVCIVDPVGNKVWHADSMKGDDPLGEDDIYLTPFPTSRNDETFEERRSTFYKTLEDKLQLQYHEGALVVARDGTVLGARTHLQSQDYDWEEVPAGSGTRHIAAQASSKLNEYNWVLLLSEQTNEVRVFIDGEGELIHDPAKKEPEEELVEK